MLLANWIDEALVRYDGFQFMYFMIYVWL